MYLLVTKQLLTMAIILVAGFIFAKAFKVGASEQKLISKLLLYFVNPCLIINSFNKEFDVLKLKQFGFVALVALILHLAMILVSTVCTLKKTENSIIDRIATVFTNCGFMGIPLINGVFGSEGVFYLMGYLVVFNILLWTWGYYQMSGSFNLKKIITNPNIIAVFLGLILFCIPVSLPEFIAKPLLMIGDMNTAMAMILIGIMFANFKMDKSMILQLVKACGMRLILCSLLNLLLIFGIYRIFGPAGVNLQDCRMMIFVIYICSMCPAATSVPSISCLFDKNTSYASLIVSVTSLLCMITIPAFVALAELVLK